MKRLKLISELLQKGKAREVKEQVQQALASGVTPRDTLTGGLVAGMGIISRKFQNNEIFVPDVLVAARAMNAGLEILEPALAENDLKPVGRAIICTVKDDLHDIGKNLVKIMLVAQRIECIDLGVDVHESKVVEAVIKYKPGIVCLSALLTFTMMALKDTIDAICDAGLRDRVRIMVGGAPVTENFAEQIGADAYSLDAESAALLARSFFEEA